MNRKVLFILFSVLFAASYGCGGGDSNDSTVPAGGAGADFDASLYYTKTEIDENHYTKTEIESRSVISNTSYGYSQTGWDNRASVDLTGSLAGKSGVFVEISSPAQAADYYVTIGISESASSNERYHIVYGSARKTIVFFHIPDGATSLNFWSPSGDMTAGTAIYCTTILFMD